MLRLAWPVPALLAWAGAWALYIGLPLIGWSQPLALASGLAVGAVSALVGRNWWRRVIVATGFPLSLLVSGAAAVPPWAWLTLLALLLALYPLHAWRDAPLFPTPARALERLAAQAPLAPHDLVLDAGCGLGHGLRALRRAYPPARLHGIEWSWPLWAWCRLRCRWAQVRRGDLWVQDWAPYRLVYLFQRPESMARAATKAAAELRRGAWLVSLEFEAPALVADSVLQLADGRSLWLYRQPLAWRSEDSSRSGDKHDV